MKKAKDVLKSITRKVYAVTLLAMASCACDLPTNDTGFTDCMRPDKVYSPTDTWVRVYAQDGTGNFTCSQVTYRERWR